jgi:hypothetical protein
VDRLFRLDHASRLDRIEAAFKALQREVGVEIREHLPPTINQQRRKKISGRRRD